MDIVGGVEAFVRDQVDTVAVGGISMIVGQSVVAGMRDRAIYLTQGLDDMDEKKLLSIIGMSQPLTFGTLQYDDGDIGYVIPKASARQRPNDKLMESLVTRLKMAPTKVIDTLVRDFGIDRPVLLAMGEFITNMIERINSCLTGLGKKSLGVIMIAPQIGELIPFVKSGLLEVSSIEDASAKWPTSFAALVDTLENFAITRGCISPGSVEMQLPEELPRYPTSSEDIIKSIDDGNLDGESPKNYVAAIILRENKLVPYLIAIEQYNVRLAHVIQEYGRSLVAFIKST